MLSDILLTLLLTLAALLLVPIAVLAVEVAAALPKPARTLPSHGARGPLAILIPAHNEAGGIAATLRSIAPQLQPQDRLLVVADNCTDGTQEAALAEGAEVVSRTDAEQRGKGFALDFGLRHLRARPPDILIMVDADCQVAPGTIDRLATMCARRHRPIQALYLMQGPPGRRRLGTQIAEFAWVVKNQVRPLGLARLNLPCQLMGSGMAFPWGSIAAMNLADSHIVEDMKMGLDLARLGVPPVFCPEAVVLSIFPTLEAGVRTQRTRWEHGHLGTILSEAPAMLLQGLRQAKPALIAMALDLSVPPLALLAMQTVLLWMAAALFYAATGRAAPLLAASSAACVFALAVLAAWAAYGRGVISFARLLSAALYPLSKIGVYARFVFSRQSEWVRSKRDEDR